MREKRNFYAPQINSRSTDLKQTILKKKSQLIYNHYNYG